VAGRIQHDPPSSGPRLFIGPPGPQPDGLRFGRVQIADRKIEMHLFQDLAARPGRRLVTGYPQCRNRGAFISHHDDIAAYRRHFTPRSPAQNAARLARRLAMGAQRGKVDNRVRERHREPKAAQRYSQARESPRSRGAQIMNCYPDARHHAAIAEQGSGPHGGDQDQTGDAEPDRPRDLQRAGGRSRRNRRIGPLLRVWRWLSARRRLRCHLRRRCRRLRLNCRAGPRGQSRKDRRG
jgi:hypothetical protein